MQITKRLLSVNFRNGRRNAVSTIVIHVTEGSAASVVSWFNNPAAEVSAHYQVRKTGAVDQFVDEDDEAWAQGRVDHPSATVVLENPGVNPNSYCISIEHEGDGVHELTDEQRSSSVELIREIAGRYGLVIDRDTVVGHHEIFSKKTCPGAIDVDRLVDEAAGGAVAFVRPDPPIVVWSEYAKDWLLVTRFASDNDWSFQPVSTIKGGVKANAPLSAMPRT